MIQDSGSRREFESGAVRDIAVGKGRCDLVPLDVINGFYGVYRWYDSHRDINTPYRMNIFNCLNLYIAEGKANYLYFAMAEFCIFYTHWDFPTAVIELSKLYEEGCQKYGDRNWEKGIPLHCYIDSGTRHFLKFLRGDDDERHDRAFLWNMAGAIWTQKHRPNCIDLPFAEKPSV